MNLSDDETLELYRLAERQLIYDHETGDFQWSLDADPRRIGKKAGGLTFDGYVRIKIGGHLMRGHRIAWWIVHHEIPDFIDHIDHNKSNNALINIRKATRSQNGANRRIYKNSKSGIKGVHRHKNGKWIATIQINKKFIYIGCFNSIELAAEAYDHAAIDGFGEFACFSQRVDAL